MDASTIVVLMVLFVLVILALSLLGGSFFKVEQAQVAIIERFGAFARTAGAGLNMKIPMIEKKAGRLSLRVQQLNGQLEIDSHPGRTLVKATIPLIAGQDPNLPH